MRGTKVKTQVLRFHPRSHENKKPKEGRSPDARRLYFRKGNGSRRTTKAWISFAFVVILCKIPFRRSRRNAPTRRRGEFDCSTSFRAQDDTIAEAAQEQDC